MHLQNFAANSPERQGFFHSHGYASSGRHRRIGATSSETFRERRAVDGNRQVVNRYNGMTHVYDTPRPKQIEPDRTTGFRAETPAIIPPRPSGFREPPARYNPYS